MVAALARVLQEVEGSIPDDCSLVSDEEDCQYGGVLSLPTLRIISIVVILVASFVGVIAPEILRRLGLNREHSLFFIVKAFGAGIILSTGIALTLHWLQHASDWVVIYFAILALPLSCTVLWRLRSARVQL
jgi:hypothetical protein